MGQPCGQGGKVAALLQGSRVGRRLGAAGRGLAAARAGEGRRLQPGQAGAGGLVGAKQWVHQGRDSHGLC